MNILTIHQLELLIFLKSSIVPEWVLKASGSGYRYGLGYGFYGHGSKIGYGKSKR